MSTPRRSYPRTGDHTALRRILDGEYMTGKALAKRLDLSYEQVRKIYTGYPITASVDLACQFILAEFEEPPAAMPLLVNVPSAQHEMLTQFLTALRIPFTPI